MSWKIHIAALYNILPMWWNGRHHRLRDKLSALEETQDVETLKFGEALTGNTEPSLEIGRCRD